MSRLHDRDRSVVLGAMRGAQAERMQSRMQIKRPAQSSRRSGFLASTTVHRFGVLGALGL